jgi:septal ring factor EnvC (AmiA/AmiB activator)
MPQSAGMKVLAGLLILVVGVLVWSLYSLQDSRRQIASQQQSNETVIVDFSNRWDATRKLLAEQKHVNLALETNLTERSAELETLRLDIGALQTDLAKSRAETRNAHDEIAKRDNQIAGLETRNVDLTQQMGDLQSAISALEREIAEAQRQLDASEGNRQELLAEIKRLQSEKITLEKQLNDLAFLRDQVRKLKEELTIARRLDWIRRGIYAAGSRKGGEVLSDMKFGTRTTTRPDTNAPSLDVELRRSGEVTVRPPTNAPAQPQ